MRRRKNLQENTSEVRDEPATMDFASQNSKEILHWTCIQFWRRRCFVDANILSKNILLTQIICQCQCFVDANILLTPIFFWHLYFVDVYILSTPIFCGCQYFVGAYILSEQRFCWIYCLSLCVCVNISNGKTSIVCYWTLSFFAFRFLKKRMFTFFRDFKCKISIEPVRFALILVHV